MPGDIPEYMCKVNPIQEELVTTQTWLKVGESVCGAYHFHPEMTIFFVSS